MYAILSVACNRTTPNEKDVSHFRKAKHKLLITFKSEAGCWVHYGIPGYEKQVKSEAASWVHCGIPGGEKNRAYISNTLKKWFLDLM